jgi:uncharacterized protein YuzE
MKITYDSEADAMMIYLKEGKIQAARSREIVPARLIIRFDADENPITIEMLAVSKYVTDPTQAKVIDLVQQALAAEEKST